MSVLMALWLVASGVSANASWTQRVGAVTGRVEVQLSSRAPRAQPSVRELGTPERRGRPDRGRSIVYLETAPQGAFEVPQPGRAVLDQREETFVPYALPITVGTTVSFPNNDRIFHNVFSFSKTKRFDLGRYPEGRTKTLRFDRAGIVRVFCEIHSHMSAFILVFSHRYYSSTDAEGRYVIDGVPPGEYDVVVWTDGQVRDSQPVTIGQGEAVTLDFVVE